MSDLDDFFQPATLTGRYVQLVPLLHEHCSDLVAAVCDGELWRLWYTSAPEPKAMSSEIDRRLGLQSSGLMLPFTVLDGPSGRTVGMTAFANLDPANRRVEIGPTWYSHSVQRTSLNTEAKLLLFTHAFERLKCVAVELRVHALNEQSRRAIERLGAKLDGILRWRHRGKDGSWGDSCVYSVIAPEWPAVRSNITWHLEKLR